MATCPCSALDLKSGCQSPLCMIKKTLEEERPPRPVLKLRPDSHYIGNAPGEKSLKSLHQAQ
jgi:hypothetical protein